MADARHEWAPYRNLTRPGWTIRTDNGEVARVKTEAAARLMAASPDLRDALRRAVDDYESREDSGEPTCPECTLWTTPARLDEGPCWYHAARAALAKADGR